MRNLTAMASVPRTPNAEAARAWVELSRHIFGPVLEGWASYAMHFVTTTNAGSEVSGDDASAEFLDTLPAIVGLGSWVAISDDPSVPQVHVTVDCDETDWFNLDCRVQLGSGFDQSRLPVVEELLMTLMDSFLAEHAVSFGCVADDLEGTRTALEGALGRHPSVAVAESEQVLRGYSWFTAVPPTLSDRLDRDELKSAGFARVMVHPKGNLSILTTGRLDDHPAAMERLFDTVAPLLPPGEPRKIPRYGDDPEARLIYRDPATAR